MAHMMQHLASTGFLLNYVTQTSIAHLPKDKFETVPIPLPPLPEQNAIAAALSDVDALIQSQDALIAKKRDLKQAAIQQLLSGKQRLPGFSGEWEMKRLGELAELKNGYAFKSETYSSLGLYKIVTIANVQDGFMDTTDCSRIMELPSDLQAHHKLVRGDLLISMTGNVGRICIVNDDNCLLNQRVGKLMPRISNDLLHHLLTQRSFIASMMVKAKGGAQGNLSVSDILEHEFQVPKSTEEQTSIAGVLSDMDAEIAALEAQRDKTRVLKQGMMQELLTGKTRLV
jgi:type I restriction enzyme S subunit